MAAPVQMQPPQAPPLQQPEPVRPPVPGGVGAAGTTIAPRRPEDIGYVETAVIAIKNFIIWLFSKIFCCFMKEETPPVLPPRVEREQAREPEEPRVLELNPRLQRDLDLLNRFHALPKLQQDLIARRIGGDRHFHWARRGDDETAGLEKIKADPSILLQYVR